MRTPKKIKVKLRSKQKIVFTTIINYYYRTTLLQGDMLVVRHLIGEETVLVRDIKSIKFIY